jgi:ketosteroid isomerase-like protein
MTTISANTTSDQILILEREALDRWGRGDPGGFLEVYAGGVTYFDPATTTRIDGQQAMTDYYRPWVGKIRIARYEMLNPHVVVDGNMAVLTYNLVNFIRNAEGLETVGSRWNSTTVYQRQGEAWRTLHSHWSFTCHPALQNLSPEASEGLQE